MVKFWSVVFWAIVLYMGLGHHLGWHDFDIEHKLGWGFALLYALLQIDLSRHREEFDKLQSRVTELEKK